MSDDGEKSAGDLNAGDVRAFLGVVRAHARVLERHATLISGLERTLHRLESTLATVVDSQREMNQLMAGIHSMYARLDCVRPRGETPSSEIRAVGGAQEG